MAQYPIIDKTMVADSTGRDSDTYLDFIDEAIKQATLLFKLGTCLTEYPDDEILSELATYGIMAMADAIYLAQPFHAMLANPFSSETIGSYSYSKLASAVSNSLPTGISFFDMALGQLSVCEIKQGVPMSGGIFVFNGDGMVLGQPDSGYSSFLTPNDVKSLQRYGYDPAGRL